MRHNSKNPKYKVNPIPVLWRIDYRRVGSRGGCRGPIFHVYWTDHLYLSQIDNPAGVMVSAKQYRRDRFKFSFPGCKIVGWTRLGGQ